MHRKGAGLSAGFTDDAYKAAGVDLVDRAEALKSDILFKINEPSESDIQGMKENAALLSSLNLFGDKKNIDSLAKARVSSFSMERIPRISRAQSMDVLSSQANIAGYRAVLESTQHFKRFFPMMMTSAGMAKPARVIVLGAGVAGLQAIATAKRLGAVVEAFDVRAEVKEQIESLGGKFIELEIGEEGTGSGGYGPDAPRLLRD